MAQQNVYLPLDKNGRAMQVASGFQTKDGTGTPQTSPLTVSTTEIELVVPDGAAELVITVTDNDLAVAEATGLIAAGQYVLIPGNTGEVIQVARGDSIFLKRAGASDCAVNFMFRMLDNN